MTNLSVIHPEHAKKSTGTILVRALVPFIFLSMSLSSFGQVGHWPLNNNANDVSGNGIDGTLQNSPAFSTDKKEGTHALVLNGTNQYVDLGNPTEFPSGMSAKTISAWAKTNVTTGNGVIFSYGSPSTSQAFYLGMNGTSLVGGAFGNSLTESGFWTTDTWQHVCMTYDGSIVKLYANGVEVNSATRSWGVVLQRAYIGRHVNNNNYWNGSIDDVRIYNTALSPSEVAALAATGPQPPEAPTNLAVTTTSTTQINLTWADNASDETGFEIERSLTSESGFSLIHTTASNAVTYTDTGLAEGTEYFYRIRSVSGTLASPYTTEVSSITLSSVAAPNGLAAQPISTSAINLTWIDNSANETGFGIERSLMPETEYALIFSTGANITTYTDNNLSSGTTYYYRIRAITSSSQSSYSNEVNATTQVSVSGDLVGHWRLNNNVEDASGNDLDGTLLNNPSFTTDNIEGSHAMTFNGTDQAVDLGNPSQFPSGNSPRSISAWAKTNTSSGDHMIFTYGTAANSQAMFIGQQGTNLYVGGFGNNLTVSNFWSPGVWHHICLTYDGTTAWLYADGEPVEDANKTWNLVLYRAFIGKHINNIGFWDGTIDDVRLYNKALSAAEVQNLANIAGTAPASPTQFVATGGNGEINLNWTDNASDETGFEIERSLTSGSGFALIHTTTANVVSYIDQGLAAGTYFYRIRAVNSSGTSSYTNEASATTTTIDLPVVPADLSAVTSSSSSITLNWTDNSTNENGFEIERSLASESDYSLVHTTGPNVTTYNDASLVSGTPYFYRIRAINANGASSYTMTVSASTSVDLPLPPTNFLTTVASSSSIDLSWVDNSTGETGFQIERSENEESGYALIHTTSANITTYLNSGLTAGTTYYYRIRAVNASGNSAYTTVAIATTTPGTGFPAAPGTLTAHATSTNSIILTWVDLSNGETGFEIQRSLSAGSGFSIIHTTNENVTSFTDTGLDQGVQYHYRVRALGTAGNSAFTAVANATTLNTLYEIEFNALQQIADSLGLSSWREVISWANFSSTATLQTYSEWRDQGELVNRILKDGDNLRGQIPSSFWDLKDLMVVRLTNCQITGFSKISNENIRSLYNLYEFDLRHNEITELPEYLGNLYPVQYLRLGHNKLTTVPSSIFYLSWLYDLDLSSNQITHLPELPDYSGWVLMYLDLTSNRLTELPATISSFTNLSSLYLSDNQLVTLPSSLSSMELSYLDVSSNNLASLPEPFNFLGYNLNVSNNYLDFSDLEPLMTLVNSPLVTYSPQKKINDITELNVQAGQLLEIPARDPGNHSTIIWEKLEDGTWVNINSRNQDATLKTFRITGATIQDAGTYRWKMTNSLVTGLTLESEPIQVNITDAPIETINPLYNGLITAVRWRTDKAYGTSEESYKGMYVFDYDDKYQIKDASWAGYTSNSYSLEGNKYRLTGMTYDPNGNIKTLRRYKENGGFLHNFTYHYFNEDPEPVNNNRLKSVDGYTNVYSYNALGQMIGEDKVEEGKNQYVEYDVAGKVIKVYSEEAKTAANLKIENIYDDRGFRLAKINYEMQRTTWYIRDASGNVISIYEQEGATGEANQNNITLTEVPVYGAGKLGTVYPQDDGSMNYEITDHLGNVRALLRDNVNIYTATMEDNGVESEENPFENPRVEEMQYFDNLFETEVEDAFMNVTPPTDRELNPDKVAYLHWNDNTGTQAADKAVGPSIALKVNAGDMINLEAWTRYEDKLTYTRDLDLIAVSALLGNTFVSQVGFEGATPVETGNTILGGLTGAGYGSEDDNTAPHAYLNYIIYDENMVYQHADWERVPETAASDQSELYIPENKPVKFGFNEPVVINQSGYIYIWLSNESKDTRVWFDDLTVTHTQNLVVQASDYGVWGDVLREQKSDERKYRFGYQGQFAEKDEETGWNHFELREYDPVVGRWTSTDPYSQYWSPYISVGNNPILNIDPDGGKGGPVWKDPRPDPDMELAMLAANGASFLDQVVVESTFLNSITDALWIYSQIYEPELYANLILKQAQSNGKGKVTVPVIGYGASLSKDGIDKNVIDPSASYISYNATQYVEYRVYPAQGKDAPGEDANVRMLVLLHRKPLKIGKFTGKAQGDLSIQRDLGTRVGGRVVGEYQINRNGTSVEVSVGFRTKLVLPWLFTPLLNPFTGRIH